MTDSKQEKLIIFALLCSGCLTISFNVAAIAAAIPAISLDLGLPDFLVAEIIPYYMIPYGLGALFYAPLTRRFNYRTILFVSLLCYGLACFFCSRVSGIGFFRLGRACMGIAGASAIPLGLLLIGKLFDKSIRGRLVGIFFSCSFTASIAGILLSGTADWRWLFIVPGIMATLTACCYFFLRGGLLTHIHGADVHYGKIVLHPAIRNVFLFIFVLSFLYHGVHKWFGVYLSQIYGMTKLQISLFFIVIAAAGWAGQILGGVISDKIGRGRACLIGLLILGLSTSALVGAYPLWLLAAVLGMVSMGWTIGHNGISTVLTDFPDRYRPEIASLNSAIRFISGGLGFFVSKFFVQHSFSGTFFVIGVIMLGLLVVLPRVIRAAGQAEVRV